MHPRLFLAFLFGGFLLLPQGPPKFFALEIPESQGGPFDSDVIELPISNISRIVIHVLNPIADRIPYGKIYPKVNGDAAAVISQGRATDQGKALDLNLKRRSDIHLVPGNNSIEVTAIDQRGRHYYKNWILRTREQARNEWFAYDSTLSPSDEAAAVPDLMIESPEYPVTFKDARPQRIKIRGMVSAVNPLGGVRVNGAVVASNASGRFSTDILVDPKDQSVTVDAIDVKGNRSRITIPVVHESKSPAPKFTGDRYALILGISRYRNHPGGPPDAFAASADADSFAHMLVSVAGFAQDRVLVLRDEKATSAQIRNAFRNFVAIAKRDDLLLIYFDGFGLHDPADPEKMYLAAHDTSRAQMPDTALDLADLQTLLSANIRSHNALLVFNVARDPGVEWKFPGVNLVNAYLLRLASSENGRAVLVSAGINQYSRETSTASGPRAIFSRWMIEAMQGKADWNHDGQITAAEMFRYVAEGVRSETKGEQDPRYRLADLNLPLVAAVR